MNYYAVKDKNGVELQVGTIVKFQEGTREEYVDRIVNPDGSFTIQYKTVPQMATGRITRLTSKWANVGSVWGGKVFAKQVPVQELIECSKEFYKAWSESESYRCM